MDRFISTLFLCFVLSFLLAVFLSFGSIAHADGPFDCAQALDPDACEWHEEYVRILIRMRHDAREVTTLESALFEACEGAGFDVYECEGDWNEVAEYHYTR